MLNELLEGFVEIVNSLMDTISSFFQHLASLFADAMASSSNEERHVHTFSVGNSESKALSDSRPYD